MHHYYVTYLKPFRCPLLRQKVGAAKKFIEDVIFPKIDAGAFSHEMDHKTQLQEVLQRKGDVSIEYRLIKEEGPAHDRTFSLKFT